MGDPLPPTHVELAGSGTVRVRKRTLAGAAAAVLVLVIGGVLRARSGGHDDAGSEHRKAVAFAPTLSQPSFGGFVQALRRRVGSTLVEELDSYDGSYSVVVPARKGEERPRQFWYDADSGLRDSGDPTDQGPRETFDLATLDIDALERLLDKAWHSAPGPVSGTSMAVAPPAEPGDSWVRIYVDQTDGSFYAIDADLHGAILNNRRIDD